MKETGNLAAIKLDSYIHSLRSFFLVMSFHSTGLLDEIKGAIKQLAS